MHISPNCCAEERIHFHWNALKTIFGIRRMFSRWMTVIAASAHKAFLKKVEKFSLFSMAHPILKRVGNFHLIWSFCWGALGAVYSNSLPITSYFQTHSKSSFASKWMHCAYLTWIPYFVFKFLMKPDIKFFNSDFSFEK